MTTVVQLNLEGSGRVPADKKVTPKRVVITGKLAQLVVNTKNKHKDGSIHFASVCLLFFLFLLHCPKTIGRGTDE